MSLLLKTSRMVQVPRTLNPMHIALYAAAFVFLLLVVMSTPRGDFVLVVTDPRRAPETMLNVIGEAGGTLVREGEVSWTAVAHSADPDFVARLRKAGALFVLNHALALGCQQGV